MSPLIAAFMELARAQVVPRLGGVPIYVLEKDLAGRERLLWSVAEDRSKRDEKGRVRSYLSSEYKQAYRWEGYL